MRPVRRPTGVVLLTLLAALLAVLHASGALSFVGGLSRPRPSPSTALNAAKKPKRKQKLSLAEALDREKERKLEQDGKKDEAKLAPERTFWEGPPSSTEVLFPFLSCFLVLGIIPFIAAVNRQFRVKYKITDRRVSVSTGWDGKDVTEFSYQEIYEMKYGLRFNGYCGDMRINLRDGAKIELFGLLNFDDNYQFIYERAETDARRRSDLPPPERFK
mmetsp:Transcript_92331/g.245318  ORF Transcript_92331/g.245318 Transcript_92331/m.245318 type:complete len:216 (-) Transcript_92331:64-711(-)